MKAEYLQNFSRSEQRFYANFHCRAHKDNVLHLTLLLFSIYSVLCWLIDPQNSLTLDKRFVCPILNNCQSVAGIEKKSSNLYPEVFYEQLTSYVYAHYLCLD